MRGLGAILGATGLAALFLACGIEVRLGSHDGSCDDGGVGEFELDPSFGDCGRVVLDVGQQENLAFGVQGLALDAQGRLLLAGAGGLTGAHDFAVLRLLSTGARDTMFGVDGVVELDVGSPFDQAEGVLSGPDGAIIVVGSAREAEGPPRSIVARLLPSGAVDLSFGTRGFVVADVAGRAGVLNGVVRRSSDGALLAAGQGWETWPGPADLQVLGRTANGEPLESFGAAGVAVADFFGSDEFGGSLAFTARGELLVPGTAWYGTSFDVAVARLAASGAVVPDAELARVSDPAVHALVRACRDEREGREQRGARDNHRSSWGGDAGKSNAGTGHPDLGTECGYHPASAGRTDSSGD